MSRNPWGNADPKVRAQAVRSQRWIARSTSWLAWMSLFALLLPLIVVGVVLVWLF